jgi:hypothetical protein
MTRVLADVAKDRGLKHAIANRVNVRAARAA